VGVVDAKGELKLNDLTAALKEEDQQDGDEGARKPRGA
jgi:hypothetical protein